MSRDESVDWSHGSAQVSCIMHDIMRQRIKQQHILLACMVHLQCQSNLYAAMQDGWGRWQLGFHALFTMAANCPNLRELTISEEHLEVRFKRHDTT